MAMDGGDDDMVLGHFLRIKIRLDIRCPLMRGVTVCVGDEEKPLWCPLEYEFLPDFCYTCGIIGHTDRSCAIQVPKGEIQQYNKNLRCFSDKKNREDGNGDRFSGGHFSGPWRSGSSGSRGSFVAPDSRALLARSGSDGPTWGKDAAKTDERLGEKKGEEDEVNSPVKTLPRVPGDGKEPVGTNKSVHKALLFDDGSAGKEAGGGPRAVNQSAEETVGEQSPVG